MFERLRIKYLGQQPAAKISSETLDKIIQREYPEHFEQVKRKLETIKSDSSHGRNRFSAAVLKLSNGDLTKVDRYIEICNNDFRDVITIAEYPRISKLDFVDLENIETKKLRRTYLDDWADYSNWITRR
jgi:hypothetical protein